MDTTTLAGAVVVTTTTTTVRPGILFCTIGGGLNRDDSDAVADNLICDYLVYTSFLVLGDELWPVYDKASWTTYHRIMKDAVKGKEGAMTFIGVYPVSRLVVNKLIEEVIKVTYEQIIFICT
ncbi:hypothetical protein V5799_023838 [Amblyomma americanum]|uniref:Uncharacterized protein n=1 Tax=Amblyomma americanum TaxID=6943 RepID=A0AAQ4FGD7_AMBAM